MTSDPITYLRISEREALPSIDRFGPFRAVVVLDGEYSDAWQDEVSKWLVDGGCLYMMAWGPDCSSWDDSVDLAQIRKFLPDEAPEEDFVLTTWHDDEPLEEVFWFSQFCAYDPYDLINNTLIVHVGRSNRRDEFLVLFEQSKTLADREAGEET